VTQWWVAQDGIEIVGFVGVGPSRDPIDIALGELDTIAVAPSHWRLGVGRSLVTIALRALAADYRDAIVWTVAGHDRGYRFYEAMGWHRDGRTRADGQEVSFRRSLADITDP
jgi:ribosomal protein S18 acetylase RimI-like enzyme